MKHESLGRGWYGFRQGNRVTKQADLRIGRMYLMRSRNNALNCIWVTGRSPIDPTIVYWMWYEPGAEFYPAMPDTGCTGAFHEWEIESPTSGTELYEALEPLTV